MEILLRDVLLFHVNTDWRFSFRTYVPYNINTGDYLARPVDIPCTNTGDSVAGRVGMPRTILETFLQDVLACHVQYWRPSCRMCWHAMYKYWTPSCRTCWLAMYNTGHLLAGRVGMPRTILEIFLQDVLACHVQYWTPSCRTCWHAMYNTGDLLAGRDCMPRTILETFLQDVLACHVQYWRPSCRTCWHATYNTGHLLAGRVGMPRTILEIFLQDVLACHVQYWRPSCRTCWLATYKYWRPSCRTCWHAAYNTGHLLAGRVGMPRTILDTFLQDVLACHVQYWTPSCRTCSCTHAQNSTLCGTRWQCSRWTGNNGFTTRILV